MTPIEREYELKLASGRVVTWTGVSPEVVIARYQDVYPDQQVVAWRFVHHGLFVGLNRILEPGDPGW